MLTNKKVGANEMFGRELSVVCLSETCTYLYLLSSTGFAAD